MRFLGARQVVCRALACVCMHGTVRKGGKRRDNVNQGKVTLEARNTLKLRTKQRFASSEKQRRGLLE